MSLFGAFDKTQHFAELDSPLVTAAGVKTPAQRRALCIANLFVSGDSNALPGTFTGITSLTSALLAATTSLTTPKLLTATNVGTVTTAGTTVAEEHGDGVRHLTKLTMTAFSLGNSGDNASLGIGAKFYTFPAGTIVVKGVSIVGGLSAAVSVTAQTPEVGIGTVIASGAVATLSTTFEDYVDGGAAGGIGGDLVAPDLVGTVFYKSALFTNPVIVKTSGGKTHDMFLNAAVAWADIAAVAPVLFTGVILIEWELAT